MNGLTASAESHEVILEQHSVDFSAFVRERQVGLDNHCSSISGWSQNITTGLQQFTQDMNMFMDAELQKDMATGNMGMSHGLSFHVYPN
jgi:hypothetical protein